MTRETVLGTEQCTVCGDSARGDSACGCVKAAVPEQAEARPMGGDTRRSDPYRLGPPWWEAFAANA